jgi:hypothetical protein
MGLDITAYSRLRPVGKHVKDPALNEGEPGGVDDWCHYDDHVQAFAYDSFPDSFRGIPVLGTRQLGGGSVLLHGGCFEVTDGTQEYDFRAGSYGGYGQWRADLQQQFNPGRVADGPFYELIWFADNEGCIGPGAAKDLLEDFRVHFERYMPPADQHAWFMSKYVGWMKAFELAADGGLVQLH